MTVIGILSLRDWDLGCYLTLDAELIQYTIDGGSRAQYVVDVSGISNDISIYQGKIPVFFDTPEDPYQSYILPAFVFRQNDFPPAWDRHPYVGMVAREGSKGATEIVTSEGREGWSSYDNQARADQYDISYDLNILARRKQELNLMIAHVSRIMRPPWFVFKVIDSLSDIRHYDGGDMSFSNTSELADIADRTQSYTVSFTVRGEIDTFEDIVSPAMTDPRTRTQMGVG